MAYTITFRQFGRKDSDLKWIAKKRNGQRPKTSLSIRKLSWTISGLAVRELYNVNIQYMNTSQQSKFIFGITLNRVIYLCHANELHTNRTTFYCVKKING
jgi:hypothetical protein